MPTHCPCDDDKPEMCPACGATVSGKDKWRGRCQALHPKRRPDDLRIILTDARTGEPV